jgi:hypothetical protein
VCAWFFDGRLDPIGQRRPVRGKKPNTLIKVTLTFILGEKKKRFSNMSMCDFR